MRLEKTARPRSCPGPLTCARGSEPGTSLPEAQSSRGGEEPRGSEGRGSPGPRRRHRDRSYTPEPADGGNCDYTQTRTHARTLDATSLGACASTPKPRPAGICSAPRHALPLTRAAPPPAVTVRQYTCALSVVPTSDRPPFSSSSAWLSMRNSCPSNTAGLFPPFSGLRGKGGVLAPLGIYLRCQWNTRTSRLQTSF